MQKTNIALVALALFVLGSVLYGAAYAETHIVSGDDFPLMIDVKNTDTLQFTGHVDGVRGIEPVVSGGYYYNCQAGWNADEVFSGCILDFSNFELGQHEWFDRTTDTYGKFWVLEDTTVTTTTVETTVETTETETPVETTTTTVEYTSDDTPEGVLAETQQYATAIQNKINEQIAPLQAEIDSLKAEKVILQSEVNDYKTQAESWKAICLEQLRIMAEVLGLL